MRSDFRTNWCVRLAAVGALLLIGAGCTDDDEPETICVYSQADGVITCDDGVTVPVTDGQPGAPGTTCTATDNGDGTVDVACDDGSTVTISDGADGVGCTATREADGSVTVLCGDDSETIEPGEDGVSCTVADNEDGTVTVTCGDDTTVIENGEDGGDCSVAEAEGGVTITCDDGTTVDVNDGPEGGDCSVESDDVTGDLIVTCEDGTEVVIRGGGDVTLVGEATLEGAADSSGILVTVEGTAFTTTTAADGSYSIADVPAGNYAMTFEFADYASVRLANVAALPAITNVPPVVLRRGEQLDATLAFAVDICVDPDTDEATSILWLEDYELVVTVQEPRNGQGEDAFLKPGTNTLGLAAVGSLVRLDPATGTTSTLGEGVLSASVHCSPDGEAIAFLQNVSGDGGFDPYYGDLVVWETDGATDVEQFVGNCGIVWSPTSNAVGFLYDPFYDFEWGIVSGELSVYERGDEGPTYVDESVGCYDPLGQGQINEPRGVEPGTSVLETEPFYQWSPNGLSLRYQYLFGGEFAGINPEEVDDLPGDGGLLAYTLGADGSVFLSDGGGDPGEYSPDGNWIVFWDYNFFTGDVVLYEPSAAADAFTVITNDGEDDDYFAWSDNSAYVAYTNNANVSFDFDLEVWDVAAGTPVFDTGTTNAEVLAVNLSDFVWTFAPDSSGVLFVEPGQGTGTGAFGALTFWTLATQAFEVYSSNARDYYLDAQYNDDGSRLVFSEFVGASIGDTRLWESATGVAGIATIREDVVYQFGNPLTAEWAPDGDSVAVHEDWNGDLALYSFVAGAEGEVVLTSSNAYALPLQFADDGASLIVYGNPESGDLAAGFGFFYTPELWEWEVSSLTGTLVSESVVYASYSRDGGSVFFIESEATGLSAPRGDVYLWPTLGSEAQLVEQRADLLSNFAHRANDALYVQRFAGYPDLLRNGPYRVQLP